MDNLKLDKLSKQNMAMLFGGTDGSGWTHLTLVAALAVAVIAKTMTLLNREEALREVKGMCNILKIKFINSTRNKLGTIFFI